MPDMLGYWDRRADNPDFNPNTHEIEPGYGARMKIKILREEAKENRNKKAYMKKYGDIIREPYYIDGQGKIIEKNNGFVGRISKNGIEVIYEKIKGMDYINNLRQNIRALNFKSMLKEKNAEFTESPPKSEVQKNLEDFIKKSESEIKDASSIIDAL